jgi:hypothetical protein
MIMGKVQSQLLVAEVTRDRADAIALVRGEPRAEVYRMALEGSGLTGLEKTHAALLAELDQYADRFGMTRDELVRRMVADKVTVEQLAGRKRYPKV